VHKLQKLEVHLKIALYQPDIAGNVGTILRLSACMGVPCAIIEPCGFPFSDKALKRSGMDYAAAARIERFPDWEDFGLDDDVVFINTLLNQVVTNF
jgi:tRNA(Leu) C34 or U34 (ribose-2'-O)-methylase TrmL